MGVYGRQPVLDALDGAPEAGMEEGAGRRRTTTRGRPGRRADPVAARHVHRAGRPESGSSPAANDPTPAPSCGSPTTRAGGSPCSPPTPQAGRLADLEVRHRLRARAEDRIRGLKDTGATNLPLQAFDKNQIWLELAQLASELLTWTQLLAWHDHPARALGTQTAPATTPRRRRTHHHQRPPPHPAAIPPMALGRPRRRRPPKTRRPHLNHPPSPHDQDPGEPATQRRDSHAPDHPTATQAQHSPARATHERSRLGKMGDPEGGCPPSHHCRAATIDAPAAAASWSRHPLAGARCSATS